MSNDNKPIEGSHEWFMNCLRESAEKALNRGDLVTRGDLLHAVMSIERQRKELAQYQTLPLDAEQAITTCEKALLKNADFYKSGDFVKHDISVLMNRMRSTLSNTPILQCKQEKFVIHDAKERLQKLMQLWCDCAYSDRAKGRIDAAKLTFEHIDLLNSIVTFMPDTKEKT